MEAADHRHLAGRLQPEQEEDHREDQRVREQGDRQRHDAADGQADEEGGGEQAALHLHPAEPDQPGQREPHPSAEPLSALHHPLILSRERVPAGRRGTVLRRQPRARPHIDRVWYTMQYISQMDDRLERLLDLLDTDGDETVGTSVRIPTMLRDAAAVAIELGIASSTTDLTVRGLRSVLEALAQRAVLDEHYRTHPAARPDLVEISLAAAAIDGHPLAERPDLVRRAAEGVRSLVPNPTPDDVLAYAAGLAAAAA